MADKDTIWVVVNAEDTQSQATTENARGCRELCHVRTESGIDMMYLRLHKQGAQLSKDDRIVMHQGGARRLGGQLLVAAGYISEQMRLLTAEDANHFSHLWEVTRRWYRRWPHRPEDIDGELIIFYRLILAESPMPSPIAIRPRRGNKFMPIHPNCKLHRICEVYDEVDKWWRSIVNTQQ